MTGKQKIRSARLDLFKAASSGTLGLVSAGFASWLLDCHRSRVYVLCDTGRLNVRHVAGQRLIAFDSLCAFVEQDRSAGRPKKG